MLQKAKGGKGARLVDFDEEEESVEKGAPRVLTPQARRWKQASGRVKQAGAGVDECQCHLQSLTRNSKVAGFGGGAGNAGHGKRERGEKQ